MQSRLQDSYTVILLDPPTSVVRIPEESGTSLLTFNMWSSVVFPALSSPRKRSFACLFMSPRDASTSQTTHIVSPDQDSFTEKSGKSNDRGSLHQLNIHMVASDRNKYRDTKRVQLQRVSVKQRDIDWSQVLVLVVMMMEKNREASFEREAATRGEQAKVSGAQATSIPIRVRATSQPPGLPSCSAAMQRTRY